MDDELLRLADLKYNKFRGGIDKEINTKEAKLTGGGMARSGATIRAVLELNFEKAKTLYHKRIEIEKKLLLDKCGSLPNAEMKQLKKTARGIIAREMRMLSEHIIRKFQGFGGPALSFALEQIREKEISLEMELNRDIEIEEREDRLRLDKEKREDKLRLEREKRKSLEEKKRERFSKEHVNSLMEIFKLRDQVNLIFKEKFGFGIFKLKQEGVIPEIATPCRNEEDFVRKILVLGNLVDWMDVDNLKSKLKVKLKNARSIKLLEEFLIENVGPFDSIIIQNLKDIMELRNKKFPVHAEGEEIIEIMNRFGAKYPPENWDFVWETVMRLYKDSIEGLIKLMSKT